MRPRKPVELQEKRKVLEVGLDKTYTFPFRRFLISSSIYSTLQELLYACRFGMDHVTDVDTPNDKLTELIREFLSTKLVLWVEVVALKRIACGG